MSANAATQTNINDKMTKWDGELNQQSYDVLAAGGGMVVSPTKVGYIVVTSDKAGLERKFDAKQRNLNKPGVVLCGSMEQLKELAELNAEVEAFYQDHWNDDILLGCILPWKKEALEKYVPDDGTRSLMMDGRGTSCFVIKFGTPSEQLVGALWEKETRLVFASSANPSGKGNRGLITGIGERIENEADLLVEANKYVKSIQPEASMETRYEQGVMVSMVDADGTLVPMQNGERQIEPCPIVIREGLDVERINAKLCKHFKSWNYRHGMYY